MAEWLSVCRLDELKSDGRGRALDIDGLRLAVYLVEDEVYVLSGRCPHANGPIGRGWIEDGEVLCPLHRWRFRLSDGHCSTVRGENLHRFPTEIRDGMIWVKA